MPKLNNSFVQSVKHSGKSKRDERHFDAGGYGLCLQVKPNTNAKSWVQCIMSNRRRYTLGLGPFPLVSLRDARSKAFENKQKLYNGESLTLEKSSIPTFEELALKVAADKAKELSNEKYAKQWKSIIERYAFPIIGTMPVNMVRVRDVKRCLSPIWEEKIETAQRLREQIGAVLARAIALEHRADNPAEAVKAVLPKVKKKVKHHPALHYRDVPAAIKAFKACGADETTKLGFEFLVLTASRYQEMAGCVWSEIDIERGVWEIPAGRIKGRKDHSEILSRRAIEILKEAKAHKHHNSDLVFPSARGGPISNATINKNLKRLELNATQHGFRSSFRVWAEEKTDSPNSVMELALAHTTKSAVEAAYMRSDLMERRRALMQGWADFCAG